MDFFQQETLFFRISLFSGARAEQTRYLGGETGLHQGHIHFKRANAPYYPTFYTLLLIEDFCTITSLLKRNILCIQGVQKKP